MKIKYKRLLGIGIATLLVIAIGLQCTAQAQRPEAIRISGYVYNETGVPIEGAYVEWVNAGTGESLENVNTIASGQYLMEHTFDDHVSFTSRITASKQCYLQNSTELVTESAEPFKAYSVDLVIEEDTSGPTITTLQPADASFINDSTPIISATYNDDSGINVSSVEILVDDNEETANATVTETGVSYTPAADLDEGSHTVTVNVSDNCTNPSSVSWSFTVDRTQPEINSVDLSPYEVTAGESITVTVNATDNVEVTSVTAEGEALAPAGGDIWTGNITAVEGTNVIVNVTAMDAAGNVAYNNTATYTAIAPPTPTPTPVRRRGGGGAPRDSDGDGYTDIQEMLAGTDKDDPCDPNLECAACLVTKPAATPTPTPTPTVTPTPTIPPVVTTPTPTPTPTEEPGFEAVFAIAGLLAVAYLALRRKSK